MVSERRQTRTSHPSILRALPSSSPLHDRTESIQRHHTPSILNHPLPLPPSQNYQLLPKPSHNPRHPLNPHLPPRRPRSTKNLQRLHNNRPPPPLPPHHNLLRRNLRHNYLSAQPHRRHGPPRTRRELVPRPSRQTRPRHTPSRPVL